MRLFVLIDDGHGKNTPGKSSPTFTEQTKVGDKLILKGGRFRENTFNMGVADNLERLLKNVNIPCRQLAPEHEDISLRVRVERQNKLYKEFSSRGFDIVTISIHANAWHPTSHVEFTSANGIETFYRDKVLEVNYNKTSKKLASLIQKYTVQIKNQRNRGIKNSPQFYILRNSYGPAVLYEGGFMTHREELNYLASLQYQFQTAEAIRKALIELQGKTYIGNLDPKTEKRV